MKKNLSLIVLVIASFSACKNSLNVSTATSFTNKEISSENENAKKGWTTLFDGKTTTGWHSYGMDKAGTSWQVVDKTLYLDVSKKDGGGDLITDAEYGDFDLKLDWKISPKGNSGIIFFVNDNPTKYKTTYNTGLEMQVLDNDGHSDGKIIKHRSGDLYDLISSSKETVKPVGEWNKVEIKSKDGKLDLYLNGTNVVSTNLWDDNWRSMVAGSKFKSMNDFGTYKKGKIALQNHGNGVWFRNIKIKEL